MAKGTATAPSGAATTATAPTVAKGVKATQGVPSLLDIARNCATSSALSDEGKAYVAMIEQIIRPAGLIVETLSIDNVEARVICTEKHEYAIVLIMKQGCQYPREIGPMALCPTLDNLWKSKFSQPIYQTLIVTEDMYNRGEKMANYAINTIASLSGQINMSIESFKGVQLNLSTNKVRAAEFINQFSPHSIPARNDIALVVSASTPTDLMQAPGMQQSMGETDLFAVSGYVDFINGTPAQFGQTPTFQPLITITDIVSKIPSLDILTLILPAIVDAFIMNEGWLAPFRRFGQGDVNLGNLVFDQKSKAPRELKSVEDLIEMRATMIGAPILVMDVTDGRARLPGMDMFASHPELVAQAMGTFLNNANIKQANPRLAQFDEIIGIYQDQVLKDSRCIDYLELAKSLKDTSRFNKLLFQPQTPLDRIRIQQEFVEVTPMYLNRKLIMDASFINMMASSMHAVLNLHTEYGAQQNLAPNLINAAQFNNFNFNTGNHTSNAVMNNMITYGR